MRLVASFTRKPFAIALGVLILGRWFAGAVLDSRKRQSGVAVGIWRQP